MGEVTTNTNEFSQFGRKLRKDFLFDDDYINLNHGQPQNPQHQETPSIMSLQ